MTRRELSSTSSTAIRRVPAGQKAIVGRNAFAHEAGIHQDGMLKDRRTYEIMHPEEVGVPKATLVLGKHSGRHAVQRRCEQLGLTLERSELETVYWEIMGLADRDKVVNDNDLAEVVRRLRGNRGPSPNQGGGSMPDFTATPAEAERHGYNAVLQGSSVPPGSTRFGARANPPRQNCRTAAAEPEPCDCGTLKNP